MALPRRSSVLRLAALAVAFALLAGCSSAGSSKPGTEQTGEGTEPGAVHVHGLGINPADGTLYAATHTGLFRIPEQGDATRVGDRYQDTMGFTVVGPNRFLGSGHPDLRDYRAGRLPSLLGLIESTDAGKNWQTLSLSGSADFHALVAAHNRIYGFDSTGGAFMVSADGRTWETRSKLVLRDFAVNPADSELILATTQTGVQQSADGGRTWTSLNTPRLAVLAWRQPDALWGITTEGAVYLSTDAGALWQQRGALPGTPEAFLADGDRLYAANPTGIHLSDDGGLTWRLRYRDKAQ